MGYHSEGTGQGRCTQEGTGQVSWGITVRAQGRCQGVSVMGYHSEGTGQGHGVSQCVMGYHSEGTGQGRCHGVSQ